jgi:nucleotide-binding universal stress UspA family protein
MKILLAIDGSEPSDLAVEEVSSRLWPAGTTVRVLSAVPTIALPATTLGYETGDSVERLQEGLTQHAEEVTGRAARLLETKGLAAETVVRYGDPRPVIVDEAEDWDADLIVVGSHGYTGLRRLFLGSVAQSVVSHAPCSVEVVRAKRSKEPEPEEVRREEALPEPVPLPPA